MNIIAKFDRATLVLVVWAIIVGALLGSGIMHACAPGKHRASGGEYIHETAARNR